MIKSEHFSLPIYAYSGLQTVNKKNVIYYLHIFCPPLHTYNIRKSRVCIRMQSVTFKLGFCNWLYLPTYGNRLCYRVHINYWSRISVGNWPLPFIKKWKNPIRRYFSHFVRNRGFSTIWWYDWSYDCIFNFYRLSKTLKNKFPSLSPKGTVHRLKWQAFQLCYQ